MDAWQCWKLYWKCGTIAWVDCWGSFSFVEFDVVKWATSASPHWYRHRHYTSYIFPCHASSLCLLNNGEKGKSHTFFCEVRKIFWGFYYGNIKIMKLGRKYPFMLHIFDSYLLKTNTNNDTLEITMEWQPSCYMWKQCPKKQTVMLKLLFEVKVPFGPHSCICKHFESRGLLHRYTKAHQWYIMKVISSLISAKEYPRSKNSAFPSKSKLSPPFRSMSDYHVCNLTLWKRIARYAIFH